MKYITLLFTSALFCCGNAKEATNLQSHAGIKSTEILSGTYKIAFIENNTELPDELSITFDETTNTVSGFSGCNNFTGKYSLKENIIKIGALATTKRLCKRFMDVEQNMLKVLSEATNFILENEALNLHNDKMVLLKANKITNARIAQEDDYTLEYIAETRGSYKMVSIKNNRVSYSIKRDAEPFTRVCSEGEIKSIAEKLAVLKLEKISTLEAPSEGRYTDSAAIGKFKITHNGTTYEAPQFDDGNPNQYISDLVQTMTSMMEKH